MGVQIREKPKGSGVWWVFINHQGRRRSKKVGTDKVFALKVAKKIEAKLTLEEFDIDKKEEPDSPTFREYAELWLSLPHDWKISTLESYQDNMRLHIYPVFEKMRLDTIKRKDLKAFFDSLLIKGLNSATVSLIRAPMSGVLSHAVDSELIESNPLRDLRLKTRSKALEVDPLTEGESVQLLEKAKEYLGGFYYPSTLCASRTGMRIGEIQALQWGDIDFSKRFIEVKRSWRKNRFTSTKNKKRRRVDMTPHLAETLKALRVNQKKRALKGGWSVPELVFDNGKGKILCREIFRRSLNKCLELAELRRIRVHDLRHTYATIRLLRGHNVGDVSYQLGHSSIKITYDTYVHWIPGTFKSEVDELDHLHPNAPYTHPTEEPSEISQSFQQLAR